MLSDSVTKLYHKSIVPNTVSKLFHATISINMLLKTLIGKQKIKAYQIFKTHLMYLLQQMDIQNVSNYLLEQRDTQNTGYLYLTTNKYLKHFELEKNSLKNF